MNCDQELLQKIKEVVDSIIRPSLNMDGGDISIISLNGDILSVKLQGACSSCPRASETLKNYVEKTLREKISINILVNAA